MTVAKEATTELVLDRVSAQLDRLYDMQGMLVGAHAMSKEPGDLQGRLLRQANELLDDIINGLDSVELLSTEDHAAR